MSGDRGRRRGINCAHDPHNSRAFRVTARQPAEFAEPRQPWPQKILGRQRCDHTLGQAQGIWQEPVVSRHGPRCGAEFEAQESKPAVYLRNKPAPTPSSWKLLQHLTQKDSQSKPDVWLEDSRIAQVRKGAAGRKKFPTGPFKCFSARSMRSKTKGQEKPAQALLYAGPRQLQGLMSGGRPRVWQKTGNSWLRAGWPAAKVG